MTVTSEMHVLWINIILIDLSIVPDISCLSFCLYQSDLFYLLIVAVEVYCCTWWYSMKHTVHLVGLFWTNDQFVSETSTWQHNTHKRQTAMFPAGFEPPVPASERPLTDAPDGYWERLCSLWLWSHSQLCSYVTLGVELRTYCPCTCKYDVRVGYQCSAFRGYGCRRFAITVAKTKSTECLRRLCVAK
jgi:hypothetical protein